MKSVEATALDYQEDLDDAYQDRLNFLNGKKASSATPPWRLYAACIGLPGKDAEAKPEETTAKQQQKGNLDLLLVAAAAHKTAEEEVFNRGLPADYEGPLLVYVHKGVDKKSKPIEDTFTVRKLQHGDPLHVDISMHEINMAIAAILKKINVKRDNGTLFRVDASQGLKKGTPTTFKLATVLEDDDLTWRHDLDSGAYVLRLAIALREDDPKSKRRSTGWEPNPVHESGNEEDDEEADESNHGIKLRLKGFVERAWAAKNYEDDIITQAYHIQWLFKNKEATATVFDGGPMVWPDVWNDRGQGRSRGPKVIGQAQATAPDTAPPPAPADAMVQAIQQMMPMMQQQVQLTMMQQQMQQQVLQVHPPPPPTATPPPPTTTPPPRQTLMEKLGELAAAHSANPLNAEEFASANAEVKKALISGGVS